MAGNGSLPLASLSRLAHLRLLEPYLRQQRLADVLAAESISDQERDQVLAAFVQERRIGSAEELDRFRQAQLLSQEAFMALIERPLRLQRHCDRLYKPKAEARFLERKTQLDRVIYSLIRLSDEGLAREIYLRLEEGEANFSDLAAEYAEGPERGTRGVVGPAPLTQAHPLLVERLRTAPAGVVQEPFQIERWWIVFRLESLTPATFDEAMAAQMSQELFEEWLDAEVAAQLNTLRPLLIGAHEGLPA